MTGVGRRGTAQPEAEAGGGGIRARDFSHREGQLQELGKLAGPSYRPQNISNRLKCAKCIKQVKLGWG